ncbi:hypothetical protein NQ314_006480 [Rhamnusium bicolor]|uniref:Uncharacterized protein n=1 Tax=Rhamnusium bicolor TaxID=1586634 RepID=A0AAV8Z1Q2_9CUCU|nr:hypothetical protein NQ314_006480 [Rhamnusium bicolor]
MYILEETNPYVSEYSADEDDPKIFNLLVHKSWDEPDNVEVLDINMDSAQELSDSEKDSTITSEFSTKEPYFLGKDGSTKWRKYFPPENVLKT